MFWGSVFITIGFIMILNYVFGIQLPIFKILFALGLIFIGIKILFGSSAPFNAKKVASNRQAIFAESSFSYTENSDNNEYSVVFGSAKLDLTDIDPSKNHKIIVHTVFGGQTIILPANLAYKIKSTTAFGEIVTPVGKQSVFGDNISQSTDFDPDQPHLELKIDTVFGQTLVTIAEGEKNSKPQE